MATLTPAQQRLLTRAHQRDYAGDGYRGELNMRGFNHLLEIARKYDKPFFGAVDLQGSAQFRVAYALAEKGQGRVVSNQVSDNWWFIASVAA